MCTRQNNDLCSNQQRIGNYCVDIMKTKRNVRIVYQGWFHDIRLPAAVPDRTARLLVSTGMQALIREYRWNMLSHGDANTDNPALVEALEITGRKPNYELRKMIDCLETLPPTNTAIDNQSLMDEAK